MSFNLDDPEFGADDADDLNFNPPAASTPPAAPATPAVDSWHAAAERLAEENRQTQIMLREFIQNSARAQSPAVPMTPAVSRDSVIDEQILTQGFGKTFAQQAEEERLRNAAEVANQLNPIKSLFARQQITAFRASSGLQGEALEEFDKIVNELNDNQLAAIPLQNIQSDLQKVKRMALGAVSEKYQNSRQNQPPVYSIGANPSGGSARATSASQYTKAQQAIIRVGQQNGMTPEQIIATLEMPEDDD